MKELSEEEKQEAYELLLESKLSDYDKEVKRWVKEIEDKLDQLERLLERARNSCAHPLIARTYENHGWEDEWNRTEEYWTSHECGVCGKRWKTGQRWKYEGDGLGLP